MSIVKWFLYVHGTSYDLLLQFPLVMQSKPEQRFRNEYCWQWTLLWETILVNNFYQRYKCFGRERVNAALGTAQQELSTHRIYHPQQALPMDMASLCCNDNSPVTYERFGNDVDKAIRTARKTSRIKNYHSNNNHKNNNNNNNVFFSVPFLLRSTRPITWNKISGKKFHILR